MARTPFAERVPVIQSRIIRHYVHSLTQGKEWMSAMTSIGATDDRLGVEPASMEVR
jgi:hypothetical protein